MENRTVDRLFVVGMWWRISYGALRVVVGFTLLHFVHVPLHDVLMILTRFEFIENPQNTLLFSLWNYLEYHPTPISYFAAIYFLFWGVVDIVLSVCLLRHQLWAFPFSLLLIVSFMVYEIDRFFETGSVLLLGMLAVDSFVLWIIYREYRLLRLAKPASVETPS